jgi:hypothetical protein
MPPLPVRLERHAHSLPKALPPRRAYRHHRSSAIRAPKWGGHYNLARQEEAAEAHIAHVEEERQRTRLLAEQHFRQLGYE